MLRPEVSPSFHFIFLGISPPIKSGSHNITESDNIHQSIKFKGDKTLFAYVVVNPTTIRSRPRWPPPVKL